MVECAKPVPFGSRQISKLLMGKDQPRILLAAQSNLGAPDQDVSRSVPFSLVHEDLPIIQAAKIALLIRLGCADQFQHMQHQLIRLVMLQWKMHFCRSGFHFIKLC